LPNLKTLIFLQAYDDARPGNRPLKNNFKWTREVESPITTALSDTFQIPPQTTQSLFSGTVTLTQDNTTQYSLTLPAFQTSIYQLTNTGGTAPTFRTLRSIGTDSSSQVTTSVNGPILTYTFAAATGARFSGSVSGLTSPFTVTANTIGTGGNSVLLVGDGSSSLHNLIIEWNTANPSNQITLTAGDDSQIPSNGGNVQLSGGITTPVVASYTGIPTGCDFTVVLTAVTNGTTGNSILLTGDGTSSINTLISNWNTANPSNQVALTSGDGSQVPNPAAPIQLSGGVSPAYAHFTGSVQTTSTGITITANTPGSPGNSIVITGDGTSSFATLISNWNTANPSNQITLTAGNGAQIPANHASLALSGGIAAPNLSTVQPGDDVLIGNAFNSLNQGLTGIWQVISKTSNSFSVVNPTGYTEGPITLGSSFANQVRIFSSAGVQIGDTLVISSGFSPVSWNNYVITLVTDSYLQFSYAGSLPTETGIVTEVAVYSTAKSMIYMESDQSLTVLINDSVTGPIILPTVTVGQIFPGLFLLNGNVYSLSVTNNSLNTATVTLLSSE
jgi:hypothetical protein